MTSAYWPPSLVLGRTGLLSAIWLCVASSNVQTDAGMTRHFVKMLCVPRRRSANVTNARRPLLKPENVNVAINVTMYVT